MVCAVALRFVRLKSEASSGNCLQPGEAVASNSFVIAIDGSVRFSGALPTMPEKSPGRFVTMAKLLAPYCLVG